MTNSKRQFTILCIVSNILQSESSCTSYKSRASFQRWHVWGCLVHGICLPIATLSCVAKKLLIFRVSVLIMWKCTSSGWRIIQSFESSSRIFAHQKNEHQNVKFVGNKPYFGRYLHLFLWIPVCAKIPQESYNHHYITRRRIFYCSPK